MCALLMLSCNDADARSYSAAPFSGRVVDAETGAPIPGVIVLAQWLVEGPAESHPVGAIQIMEAVTDEQGRYSFPGWGPKSVPRPDFWSWIIAPVLSTHDPDVHFFKSGYRHVSYTNLPEFGPPEDSAKDLRRSQLDGKDVRLTKLKQGASERTEEYREMLIDRPFGIASQGCTWLQMPLTVRFMGQERRELLASGQPVNATKLVDYEHCERPSWLTSK
ncbi:MAG TPA: carboxypeptidase-like regulatory domain-containing protein [Burkholderiales bacterium]|nr:carboxypeptidase-like regulatory domain-containing protein [Burkholderiales bacterium]